MDSSGSRNASMMEVFGVDDAAAAAAGAVVSGAGAVAGAADGRVARGQGAVLDGNCLRAEDGGRSARGGRVVAGCVPVVPPRWRGESMSLFNSVGQVLVVWRA